MGNCKDCLQNCPEIISDQCVQYTGPDLLAPFNVCQGDQLSIYEANIVAAIQSLADGTNTLPTSISITACTWFQQQFGTLTPNINNLLQTLINGECSLYSQIIALAAQVSSFQSGSVIDTACLSGLTNTPSLPEIVQSIITLLCNINTTVNAFPSTYVRNSDLTNLVTTIVNNINGGGGTVSQFNSRMVPFTAMPYFGPLSNFDSSGGGISSLGFSRVFVCNGLNGTPDLRGRVPVGAIRNVPGGALDPSVDPTVSPNNPNWALNDKGGETFHTLSSLELAAHTHPVNDPGHSHVSNIGEDFKQGGSGGNAVLSTVALRGLFPQPTLSATTGISIQTAGGNQPHNNIQPSIASYYIMYIP